MLFEISNDVFFINQRIKEIDKNYKIYFNNIKNKFEIHNIGQIGGSYCLTVPFRYLDERTINLVKRTLSINSETLLKEIDENNEKLRLKHEKIILENAKDQLYEEIKYNKN